MHATARYVALAEKHGLTPTALALAWANSRWYNASIIIGTTTVRQVEECVAAFTVELSEEVLKEVDMIHEEFRNPAVYYTTDTALLEAKWLGEGARPASKPEEVVA